MSKRVEYIDVAKGIGILLVVLGHNKLTSSDYPLLLQIIYSFHMPLFFLLSGVFFKPDYGFWELAKRRFRTLLLPFITTLLFLYLGSGFFSNMSWDIIIRRLAKATYAGVTTLDWVPLWFLPHLFLVVMFSYLFIKLIYDRLPALWMRLLLLLALLGIGVYFIAAFRDFDLTLLGRHFKIWGLPWSADILPITAAFFVLGYELFRTVPEETFSRWWLLLGATVLFFGLNLAFPYVLNFYARRYDSFIVVTIEALAGITMTLCISKWLEMHRGPLFTAFQYLGNASIIILLFHIPVQDYTFKKLASMGINDVLGGILAFILAVLIPVMMYAWLIRPNPVLSSWFGLPPKPAK